MSRLSPAASGLVAVLPGPPVRLWVPKLFYLFFYAAIGTLAPYFNLFLQQRGLSGVEIGLLGSIPPLVALAANPFWGAVADRWRIHKWVLAFCVFMGGLVTLPFVWVNGFGPILALVMLMVFFRAPVPALVDTAVLEMVAQTGASYGRQRLFGSIGFLSASYGIGLLLSQGNLVYIFWVHGALLIFGCTALSFLLPMSRHHGEQHGLWQGLRMLVRQRRYMSFLVMNIFFGFGVACYVNFVGLRLLSLGATEAQVGLGFALGALTEIPVMFLGARLMARFSLSRLIVTAVLGLASAYTLIGLAGSPVVILAVMATIGFFGGTFWMSIVAFTNDSVPRGLRATGQALIGATQGGLGWALGSIASGVLWDLAGGTVVLLVAGVSLVVGAGVFVAGQRGERKEE